MRKFTYGYLKQAIMNHLDLDDEDAEMMRLFEKFPFFANEAIQAICSAKPKYDYVKVRVVNRFDPLVLDGSNFILATQEQIRKRDIWMAEHGNELWDKNYLPSFAKRIELENYWHEQGIYEIGEYILMSMEFISFANNRCFKYEKTKYDCFDGKGMKEHISRQTAKEGVDFDYIGNNQLIFHKDGDYEIPAKFMWYVFSTSISDYDEIDMPSDIFMTIPLYVASLCLQMSDLTKSQMKRNEFELALSKCTATNFLEQNIIQNTW